MKYSKFIKENIVNKNSYLLSCVFAVLLFVALCFFGTDIRATYAGFSGNTAVIEFPYKVYYSSNFPSETGKEDVLAYEGTFSNYIVLENLFDVPNGYEFVSWNTSKDGTGIEYYEKENVIVTENIKLYAQWRIAYEIGNDDENIDDKPTNEESNEDTSTDDGDNSNNSGNVTEDEDMENPTDGKDDSDTVIDSSNSGSSGSGTSGNGFGSGSSSNGNSSSGGASSGGGSGTSGAVSGGNSSGNGNVSSGGTSNNGNSVGNNSDVYQETVSTNYQFKFVNGNNEFANTNCEVLEDRTCELVLPDNNPIKEGYTFKGWSLSNLCYNDDVITESIKVNSDNTYYACFEINIDIDDDNSNEWIYLVVSVWVIACVSIYFIVRRFKNNEIKEEND